ncbi:MAG: hypothetical protein WKH64_17810 [Chloroflexia bacterium]
MGITGNESVLESAVSKRHTPATRQEHAAHSSLALPENPLIKGGAAGGAWPALNFRELWSYRELLYFLTWRDIKVRYKQTAMGAAWAVVQPFVTMLVFTLFSASSSASHPTASYPFSSMQGCCRGRFSLAPSTTVAAVWSAVPP